MRTLGIPFDTLCHLMDKKMINDLMASVILHTLPEEKVAVSFVE
jgi:hypothetical protein